MSWAFCRPTCASSTAARPEQITPLYWELHTSKRDEAELVFRLDSEGFPRA
ncbi:hypothetical protein [Streptomyces sp. MBT65]|uniref:hypothetical protein n=1 Tax=Streptomyces sp. MBT65 TaxID=1488395 RepID=UPI001F3C8FF0|nr:hypothetical protein [Streptomyces sp. MBT65]